MEFTQEGVEALKKQKQPVATVGKDGIDKITELMKEAKEFMQTGKEVFGSMSSLRNLVQNYDVKPKGSVMNTPTVPENLPNVTIDKDAPVSTKPQTKSPLEDKEDKFQYVLNLIANVIKYAGDIKLSKTREWLIKNKGAVMEKL